jgi:CTP:molybdopterin cytidylyltransferase MocA
LLEPSLNCERVSAPSAPVPITSRRHRQGMSSAAESGVCPYALRNLLDAAFLALADLPAVDDQVVIVGHAVDSHRTE